MRRYSRSLRRLFCGLAAIHAFAISANAGTPTIRDKSGRFEATLAPRDGWCSSVVSVDLRSTREAFQNSPEDVQRFIGSVRAGVLADCPSAEIIRLHGFTGDIGAFVAYTAKKSGWRIQLFPSDGSILPMLDGRRSSTWVQELAFLETRTYFDRAKLLHDNVSINGSGGHNNEVVWRIEGIDGITYSSFDWQKRFISLGDLADTSVRIVAERCASEGGKIENAARREVAAVLQVRSFECDSDRGHLYVGLVVVATDNVESTFVLTSEYKSVFSMMLGFLTDKELVY